MGREGASKLYGGGEEAVKFYPYEKIGGGGQIFSHAAVGGWGGTKRFWGSLNTGSWKM